MNSEIFIFEKSLEKRLEEYLDILRNDELEEPISSEISSIWSTYLESSIELLDWRAVWNVSDEFLTKLQLFFPLALHVMIDSVDCFTLTANVTIIDVQAFVDIPRNVTNVPLRDLYVTIVQENTALDFSVTAECLDQLRIFYNHLWRLWDNDAEHERDKWVSMYLHSRLKLYYDLINGNLHRNTSNVFRNLLEKYNKTSIKLENIQMELSSFIDLNGSLLGNDHSLNLLETFNNLNLTKTMLQLWENSHFRQTLNSKNKLKENNSCLYIVMLKSNLHEVAEYFSQIKTKISSSITYKKVIQFSELFVEHFENDVIFLTPGIYILQNSEIFSSSITLNGLTNDAIIVIAKYSDWCSLLSLADNLILQNLTFEINNGFSLLFIKEGVTTLNSIIIRNKSKAPLKAIVVGENAVLKANQCTFCDFDIAVICLKNSVVELLDCTFQNNEIGIQIFKDAHVEIKNCDMFQTKKVPLRCVGFENHGISVNVDHLSLIDGLNIDSTKINDNMKAAEFV